MFVYFIYTWQFSLYANMNAANSININFAHNKKQRYYKVALRRSDDRIIRRLKASAVMALQYG